MTKRNMTTIAPAYTSTRAAATNSAARMRYSTASEARLTISASALKNGLEKRTTAMPEERSAAAASTQTTQTRKSSISGRPPLALALPDRDGRVVEVAVCHGHALDRLGEQHVLRIDEVVARVLRDFVFGLERDRVEGARKLAVPAEDAAREIDLVDPRVTLSR